MKEIVGMLGVPGEFAPNKPSLVQTCYLAKFVDPVATLRFRSVIFVP